MIFVLIIAVIVIAGWIYLANNQNSGVVRSGNAGSGDYAPMNAYDNPYDTNENNDRPFEPDTCSDTSDDSSSDSSCDSGDTGSSD
ncbi:hypothetical protein [Lysobacter sp. HA35]